MTTFYQRINSPEFVISLLMSFLLLVAGKCFSQAPVPLAFQNYTIELVVQPDANRYALRLEVETDAAIALSLHDAQGLQLAVLLPKTELHAGVYFFDVKNWLSKNGIFFLKNGSENLMRFEVPACTSSTFDSRHLSSELR